MTSGAPITISSCSSSSTSFLHTGRSASINFSFVSFSPCFLLFFVPVSFKFEILFYNPSNLSEISVPISPLCKLCTPRLIIKIRTSLINLYPLLDPNYIRQCRCKKSSLNTTTFPLVLWMEVNFNLSTTGSRKSTNH